MLYTLQHLLASIVDYAGLFPPAQLSLPEAMAIYIQAQSSSHQWMLDRFVLPATFLPDWIKLLPAFSQQPKLPKPLSVILSQNWRAELEQIQQISKAASEAGYLLQISALEVTSLSPSEIEAVCFNLPNEVDAFFEIPFNVELEPYLKVLSHTGRAAKLRTGGISANAFPDSAQLSQRVLAFADAQISFKATAGLHHPLRGDYRLTYQPNSPSAAPCFKSGYSHFGRAVACSVSIQRYDH
jgi:hypothetical protein